MRSGKYPSKNLSPQAPRHLPRALTSFIGREREVEEVAAALGVQKSGEVGYQSILIQYLQPLKTMLILDNCEHLLDACIQIEDTRSN